MYPQMTKLTPGEVTKRSHGDTEGEWRTQVGPSHPLLPFGTHMGLTTCIAAWQQDRLEPGAHPRHGPRWVQRGNHGPRASLSHRMKRGAGIAQATLDS